MQFKVPQNVQREDHIVGPLTLRQLIICGVGGGIAYAIYVSLGKYYELITSLPPTIIIGLITILFAFIRPLDLTFAKFLLTYLEFQLIPRKRSWIQASAEVTYNPFQNQQAKNKAAKKEQEKADQVIDKARKLEEISKILDSH